MIFAIQTWGRDDRNDYRNLPGRVVGSLLAPHPSRVAIPILGVLSCRHLCLYRSLSCLGFRQQPGYGNRVVGCGRDSALRHCHWPPDPAVEEEEREREPHIGYSSTRGRVIETVNVTVREELMNIGASRFRPAPDVFCDEAIMNRDRIVACGRGNVLADPGNEKKADDAIREIRARYAREAKPAGLMARTRRWFRMRREIRAVIDRLAPSRGCYIIFLVFSSGWVHLVAHGTRPPHEHTSTHADPVAHHRALQPPL